MKKVILAALVVLPLVGCKTTEPAINEPAGSMRSWEPANIDMDRSAVPVNPSTDTDKHVWTDTPIPNVRPLHSDW